MIRTELENKISNFKLSGSVEDAKEILIFAKNNRKWKEPAMSSFYKLIAESNFKQSEFDLINLGDEEGEEIKIGTCYRCNIDDYELIVRRLDETNSPYTFVNIKEIKRNI